MTKKGHRRGTSHYKKKYDRQKQRNFYAKDLMSPDHKYRQRVIAKEKNQKMKKKAILDELDEKD